MADDPEATDDEGSVLGRRSAAAASMPRPRRARFAVNTDLPPRSEDADSVVAGVNVALADEEKYPDGIGWNEFTPSSSARLAELCRLASLELVGYADSFAPPRSSSVSAAASTFRSSATPPSPRV
jgi:hypothetical protein